MIRTLALYGVLILFVQLLFSCSETDTSDSNSAGDNDGTISGNDNASNAQEKQTNDADPKEKLMVTFGDSLYAGYGLDAGDGLAPELERQFSAGGASIKVHSAGVSGDTTAAGLQRLAFVLDNLKRKPDLVMVGLGGNDMLRGIGPDQTKTNLIAIMEELKSRGIQPMLTGMIAAPNMGPQFAEEFNPIFSELAKTYNAPLDPFILDNVITDPSLMLDDGIHPTAEGIDIIAKRLAPIIAETIDQPFTI